MSIAFTQLATISADTNNVTSYAGTAGTPNTGDILICAVFATATVAAGTMTGGGFTWVQFASQATGANTLYLFYTVATSATSTTPTFDCTGDAATGALISCFRVSGSEGFSVRQSKFATGSTVNPAISLTQAPLTTNGIFGFAVNVVNSSTQWTPPTNWTEGGENAYATPSTSMESAFRNSGETGTSLTWTNANASSWILFAAELWIPRNRSVSGGAAYSSPMFY